MEAGSIKVDVAVVGGQPVRPTMGRVVFYVVSTTRTRPAIINDVLDVEKGVVNLTVFTSTGAEPRTDVTFSPEPKAGCWHWPPR